MTDVNLLHIALFSAAAIICITGLLFTVIQKRTDLVHNKIYIILVGIVLLNSVSQIIREFAQPFKQNDVYSLAMKIGDYSYFLFHTALCPLFFLYVSCICGARNGLTLKRNIIYASIFIVTELLVIINPLTHWVYHYDQNLTFVRGWGEYLIYFAAGFYLVYSIIMLLFTWSALTAKRRVALIYFFVVVVLGVSLQLIKSSLKVELFAEALALLGVMIAIESEDDRIDVDTGVYNRKALQYDLSSYIVNKRRLTVICVKIINSDLVEHVTGSENADLLPLAVSGFLRQLVPRYCIYNTSPGTFIITVFDSAKALKTAHVIDHRFKRVWHIRDSDVLLNAVIMAAEVPDRIKTASDAFYMADSPVPANKDKTILTDKDLDYLMRRSAVEGALARGVDEGLFEVYYQPTYSLSEKRLHGAEALVRLHDTILGNIYPDEFIPIAEQNGLIDSIDDFVLREVCSFIKSGVPASFGIDCINVNLSVLECMQPGFVDHINKVTDEYGIDKQMINFEITESTAAGNYELLSNVVAALKKSGFHFSMDDYGTGYSNMRAIFMLDFDIVKIDKSILWSAEESELGKIILESSVHMIKQMQREILVEGVETQGQLDLLKALSVDYLQGYFFSKPIPKKEFIELIQNAEKLKG
ncbi:MAG: EAL domain-containing protein [Ruminococcus sp.]|nr:EAL domain-containing protein [Ruminococcus sp.]